MILTRLHNDISTFQKYVDRAFDLYATNNLSEEELNLILPELSKAYDGDIQFSAHYQGNTPNANNKIQPGESDLTKALKKIGISNEICAHVS